MNKPTRQLKFSGLVSPNDLRHQVVRLPPGETLRDQRYVAPNMVEVTISTPPPAHVIGVPQYSPAIFGRDSGYNPAADCDGAFMSAKFQPNNNCYAYACNIASNSFAQPGRRSGIAITAATLNGPSISSFAGQDGLIYVGQTRAELAGFAQTRRAGLRGDSTGGHYVALMISAASGPDWPGDYHWARCDDSVDFASWSQKDGGDQVTNFDFAGNPIVDPAAANWSVNQGPIQPDRTQPDYNPDDLVVSYAFYCYMFVPDTGVNIV